MPDLATRTPSLRHSRLDRDVAMRLAEREYSRTADLLASLGTDDWSQPTCCDGWDVRALAGHLLGMTEMAASFGETARQIRAARKAGGDQLDALTAHQVEKFSALSPAELVSRFRDAGRRAARHRRRTPAPMRRMRLRPDQRVGDTTEPWAMGFLVDTILTRDPWLHRSDLHEATGVELELTAEHDGAIVADVVQEWIDRHGQPVHLTLTGPAGGQWTVGDGGPELTLDAVEFCRVLSGRGPGTGLLATQVPF